MVYIVTEIHYLQMYMSTFLIIWKNILMDECRGDQDYHVMFHPK